MRKLEDMNKLPVAECKESFAVIEEQKQKENSLILWFASVSEFFIFNEKLRKVLSMGWVYSLQQRL